MTTKIIAELNRDDIRNIIANLLNIDPMYVNFTENGKCTFVACKPEQMQKLKEYCAEEY